MDPTVVSLENEPVIRHLKRTLVQVFFLILKMFFLAVAYKNPWNLKSWNNFSMWAYLISCLVMAMHSFFQAELGRSLRISSLEVLDTANRIKKTKASLFPSFLLLRDLSMIWVFSVYDCSPFRDCMFMLRSNRDFDFRKLKSMKRVTDNISKALF